MIGFNKSEYGYPCITHADEIYFIDGQIFVFFKKGEVYDIVHESGYAILSRFISDKCHPEMIGRKVSDRCQETYRLFEHLLRDKKECLKLTLLPNHDFGAECPHTMPHAHYF